MTKTSFSVTPSQRFLSYELLSPFARVPERAYDHAVGYDLYACIVTETGNQSIAHLLPGHSRAIPTGLILSAPPGYFIMVCSRSGLAAHNPPIFVTNAPGIIDPDYTGEVKALLYNGGKDIYTVRHHERVAQAIIMPYNVFPVKEAKLADLGTVRGAKGLGSTGK